MDGIEAARSYRRRAQRARGPRWRRPSHTVGCPILCRKCTTTDFFLSQYLAIWPKASIRGRSADQINQYGNFATCCEGNLGTPTWKPWHPPPYSLSSFTMKMRSKRERIVVCMYSGHKAQKRKTSFKVERQIFSLSLGYKLLKPGGAFKPGVKLAPPLPFEVLVNTITSA